MPLDELVFQRELLIRGMKEATALLEKAADSYNPEKELCIDDVMAALVIDQLKDRIVAYARTLLEHGAAVTTDPQTRETLERALDATDQSAGS